MRRAQLGDTPLHLVAGSKARAFSEQHLEDYAKCVTVLCDAGALLEAQDNVRGSGRCAQMGWIAAPNDVQHASDLASAAGANTSSRGCPRRKLPMRACVGGSWGKLGRHRQGTMPAVSVLAPPTLNHLPQLGQTALTKAARSGHTQVYEFLKASGAPEAGRDKELLQVSLPTRPGCGSGVTVCACDATQTALQTAQQAAERAQRLAERRKAEARRRAEERTALAQEMLRDINRRPPAAQGGARAGAGGGAGAGASAHDDAVTLTQGAVIAAVKCGDNAWLRESLTQLSPEDVSCIHTVVRGASN